MFTSAELIEALRRRMRRSLRPPPPPGEFPPGWRDWFLAMAARPGRVTGASAGEVIAAVALRGPVPRAGGDERWMRIASMSGSLLVHLLLVVAIAWLMFTRFHFSTPAAEARVGEEHVLQVEYIGEGTPADAGGGMAASPIDEAAEPAPAAPAVPTAASVPPAPGPKQEPALASTTAPPPLDPLPVEEPPVPEPGAVEPVPLPVQELVIDVPMPEVREVQVVPQALQVTEVEVADRRFEVPPPRDVRLELPREVRPAEVAVRPRAVDIDAPVEARAPAVPAPRRVEFAVPGAAAPEVAVRERRLDLADAPVLPSAPLRDVAGVQARQPDARVPGVRERSVPMPAERPAATAAQESAAAVTAAGSGQAAPDASSTTDGARDRAASSAPAATDGGRTQMQGAAAAAAPAAGAGQLPGQPPGALPSSRVSDDWGDSTRNVTGRQAGRPEASGLFNADGSVRLADGGRVGGGLPPGAITEDFENVDRHGTWLKRPPYDYEPTSFERFWLPSETLLEEWVRASVTEVLIPIPGTTKSIRCVTVLLALGGGCGIVDPNLQEQPAAARPPPEVPFKRELQEDQGSLGPTSPPEP